MTVRKKDDKSDAKNKSSLSERRFFVFPIFICKNFGR